MEKKEVKTTIDELEIEPLSDEALRMVTGGEILCVSGSCVAASCSVYNCSPAGDPPDPREILDGVKG